MFSLRRRLRNGARRILLVAGYADSVASFRGALIQEMLQAGWEVHVAAPGLVAGTQVARHLESMGVICHEVPLDRTGRNIFLDARLVFRLFWLCRKVAPRVFLAYTIKPVVYGLPAAALVGVERPYALITGLGYAFTNDRKSILFHLARLLYSQSLRVARIVFFQNPDDRDLMLRIGVLSKCAATIIVNGSGVDLSAYAAKALPSGPPMFLMICRLLGDKGVREYVAAARKVREKRPWARFCLAGWIDRNPDAISQGELDSWIADGSIEYLGRLDDVRPALAQCTAYVLPSYREGTPRTVLEAMAIGRPIITTDAPGCRETVIDGFNGFLVPPKCVDGLVKAMLTLIDQPEVGIRMGGCSRELAVAKYDVRNVNAAMLSAMEMNNELGGGCDGGH